MLAHLGIFELAALVLSLAALFSYVNHRFIGLPTTIGVMLMAIVTSGALVLLGLFGLGIRENAAAVLHGIDFSKALLHGMLSFLLFAGALNINLEDLAKRKYIIGVLATGGLVLAMFIIAGLSKLIFSSLGVEMPFVFCVLFGALISPTDPIAVMGILKKAGVPKSLETKITGESLFNDGVGVVAFLVVMSVVEGGHDVTASQVALLFVRETIGGLVFGLVTGWLTFKMLQSIDNYQVEALLTLALVMGGYALANMIHVSGPIAMVVAGVLIGNTGRRFGMSDTTREHLDSFWELIDAILNAVLFLLIGLEVLVLTVNGSYVVAGLLMIPAILIARFISVGIPVTLLRPFRTFSPKVVRIMTWGGLRGGISVALALSIPSGPQREVLLTITYIVVVFSILVQGLTVGRFVSGARENRD